jgi:CheY-like chemotaxis protein
VTVSSETGKGSVFRVYLPIIEAQVAEFQGASTKQLPKGTERILLVDDEEAIIRSLQALTEGLGYSVRSFSQSTLAWKTFHNNPEEFDIVVTDYTMPRMTGIVLAEKIRGVRPDIPIIICSGHVSLKEKCHELEPISFVRKPVTTFELSHALRQALTHGEPVQ